MLSGGAVADGISTLLAFSNSLSCPVHCHPSLWLPLAAGLAFGILIGLGLGLWLAFQLLRPFPVPSPDLRAQPSADLRRRSARLAGYLHE